ncbi:MAG: TRAP transporter small permease subunit [Moraxellaceae bacterium]|nr:MAG: TRAP transporter small permease subunit [Moraxellaceae bacterium]
MSARLTSSIVSVIDVVDSAVTYIGKFASLLIVPLVFITVFDVVTRKFVVLQQFILESPLHDILSPTKLQEMEWHLHAAIFLLTFGYAYLSNAHVRVDLIRETFAPRKQMVTELFGLCLLALPYVSLLIYYAWDFVQSSYAQQEMSSAMTGLPYRWIIKSVFLAGVVILSFSIITTIIRILIILCSRANNLQQSLAAAGTSLEKFHVLAHEPEVALIVDPDIVANPVFTGTRVINNTSGRKS